MLIKKHYFISQIYIPDVAMNLTKDLIATGIAKLLPQIKNKNSANISGSIITPN